MQADNPDRTPSRRWRTGLSLTLALVAVLAAGGSTLRAQSPPRLPSVPVDEELASFLRKAREKIDEGQYDEAIRLLDALIQRPDSGFIRVAQTDRYRDLRRAAVEILGTLPEEGLARYRRLYDPPAERAYKEAVAAGDPAALRDLVSRYLHTSYGGKALDALGELCFERGLFNRAAWYWADALEIATDAQKGEILAKLALAAHLAEDDTLARRSVERLRRDHPGATLTVAGRSREAVAFAEEALSWPVATYARSVAPDNEWLGRYSGGPPRLMDEANVVLMPRWVVPEALNAAGDIRARMIALSAETKIGAHRRSNASLKVAIDQGRAMIALERGGRRKSDPAVLPAAVEPLVVDGCLIYRSEEAIEARDMYTGQLAWRSYDFPLTREGSRGPRHPYSMGVVVDYGRHALSVGGGMVYATGKYHPGISYRFRRVQQGEDAEDDSALAAFSLAAEGGLVWQIGRSKDVDAATATIVNNCKFLSAPTYDRGRLYTMVQFAEGYWLVCLDPHNKGDLLWHTQVAQMPALNPRHGHYGQTLLDVGTPPAAVEGRVYAATNTGVVASFDARTGQPIWAHEYESEMRAFRRRSATQVNVGAGMNPILVTGGRVVVMPSDSDAVMCFSAEDGRILWQRPRNETRYLDLIDENRLLLSGSSGESDPGLFVLSMTDGRVLSAPRHAVGVHGRPAIAPSSVLASGPGRLYRLDLETYAVTSTGPGEPDALLGNLVSVSGRVYAANSLGICVYAPYKLARRQYLELLENVRDPAKRIAYLRALGNLAFTAGRYEQARNDFQAVLEHAREMGDKEVAPVIQPKLYLCTVGLGLTTESPQEALNYLLEAQKLARTDQEKAHMLLRLAKFHKMRAARSPDQALDHAAKAVEYAQMLRLEFEDERIFDVEVGPDAAETLRRLGLQDRFPARTLGERFIKDLIAAYGRECYAKFDRVAGRALAKASLEGNVDRLFEIAQQYNQSQFRDDALFRAAEILYERAAKTAGADAEDLTKRTVKALSGIGSEEESELMPSATVALAVIYARAGQRIFATFALDKVRDLEDQDQLIRFASMRGKLGEMIEEIEAGRIPEEGKAVGHTGQIRPPLAAGAKIDGLDNFILRDHRGKPVYVGQAVMVLRGKKATLLDPASANPEKPGRWVGVTDVDAEDLRRRPSLLAAQRLVAGIDPDQEAVVVADHRKAIGFDAATSERIWEVSYAGQGIPKFHSLAVGRGVLLVASRSGELLCLEIDSGRKRWIGQSPKSIGSLGPNIEIGRSLVAAAAGGRKGVCCFDLETGKLVKQIRGSNAQALITSEDLLVVLADGRLQAFDPTDPKKPVWTREYDAANAPALLGASSQFLAVSSSAQSSEVEVLSVLDASEPVARLWLSKLAGRGMYPAGAVFDNGGVVVLAGWQHRQTPMLPGGPVLTRGLAVQRYDFARRRIDWKTTLVSMNEASHCIPRALSLGKDHLFLTAALQHNAARAFVIDRGDGRKVESIDLGEAGSGAESRQRIRNLGSPAVLDGRMVVETVDGLQIYKGG